VISILVDYRGRNVRLTGERLVHIRNHAEMIGLEPLLATALRQPAVVIESRSDPTVLLYYYVLAEPRVGVRWMCVVVKYLEQDAFVLTAYLTDRPKKGRQLWPAM
jgi:hypothetical protein